MSFAHTHCSTSDTSQPAVSPATQQEPSHVPQFSAATAQASVQEEPSQHSGRVSQTQRATSKLLQAWVGFATQQEPVQEPQSVGQLKQSSPPNPSQIPLPQKVEHWSSTHAWLSSQGQSVMQFPQFSPSPQYPSPQHPTHSSCANTAQSSSHATVQQSMSNSQTQDSVNSIAQPGVPCASQQAPSQLPQKSAAEAQRASHATSQQLGFEAHTQDITSVSIQPGLPLSRQHEPSQAPQSAGQSKHPSSSSQIPSPQQAELHSSLVLNATHSSVHSSVQHSEAPKVWQTQISISWYLHPGVSWGSQHSPPQEPH